MSSSMSGRVLLRVIEICAIATTVLYHHSDAAGPVELQEVCQRTEDPQLCYEVFNDDRRTPEADMAKLCLIIVDRTLIEATSIASSRIPEILRDVTDPEVMNSLKSCQSIYWAAGGDFTEARVSAIKNNFPDVWSHTQEGANQVIKCDNIDKGTLTDENHIMIKFAGIIVSVLDSLGVS